MKHTLYFLAALLIAPLDGLHAADPPKPAAFTNQQPAGVDRIETSPRADLNKAAGYTPVDRPDLPAVMHAMSDKDFSELFFAQVNLEQAGLEKTKAVFLNKDSQAAMEEWHRYFVEHVASMPETEWTGNLGAFPLAQLMDGISITMSHGKEKPYGLPMGMDWHGAPLGLGLSGWNLPQNLMWHPKIIIKTLEDTVAHNKDGPYSTADLLTRWQLIWRDFANNNWRTAMRLAGDQEYRQKVLKMNGLDSSPDGEWGHGILWRQPLVLSWLINNWLEQVNRAIKANPVLFSEQVPARAMAEVVYFMTMWPIDNLMSAEANAGDIGGVPNQTAESARALVASARMLSGMRAADRWAIPLDTFLNKAIGIVQPDGSDPELSYNYNYLYVGMATQLLKLTSDGAAPAGWVDMLKANLPLREKFLASLGTPGGSLILGLNSYKKQVASPDLQACTSIAFPWHGLYVMRENHSPQSLLLALSASRRGNGHEAEGVNKLHVEAYGTYLLIDTPGEAGGDYNGYSGSSWSKNTINVDGHGQAQTALPRHSVYAYPMENRWYSSRSFDFAENEYSRGYGNVNHLPKEQRAGRKSAVVDNVSHARQVIFVKEARLWMVTDVMVAPADETHDYAQVWKFNASFPKESVVTDASAGTIRTSAPKNGGNLFLYQSAMDQLSYRAFYGQKGSVDSWDPFKGLKFPPDDARMLPPDARGWMNTGGGAGKCVPAVDVHATWSGKGRQTLVTAIIPSPDAENPVLSVERGGKPSETTGLNVVLEDGSVVRYETSLTGRPVPCGVPGVATAVAWLTLERSGESLKGILLDSSGIGSDAGPTATDRSLEFSADHSGRLEVRGDINIPTGFRWERTTTEGKEQCFPRYDSGPVRILPEARTLRKGDQITLSYPAPGTEIRYTLDGSMPTQASLLYAGAFGITRDTIVRALAYYPNGEVAGMLSERRVSVFD